MKMAYLRPQVPQNKVIVSATRDELIASGDQRLSHSGSICLHLLGVVLELWCGRMLQSNSQRCNLVVVRATLERWKDSEVDLGLEIVRCSLWLTLSTPIRRLDPLKRRKKVSEKLGQPSAGALKTSPAA